MTKKVNLDVDLCHYILDDKNTKDSFKDVPNHHPPLDTLTKQ